MLIPVLCECIYKYLQTLNHEIQIVLLLFVLIFLRLRLRAKIILYFACLPLSLDLLQGK